MSDKTVERRAMVSDEVVIGAWQEVALSGSPDACVDLAAEKAGMVKESYVQRMNKIRRMIAEQNQPAIEEWKAACEAAKANGEEEPAKPELISLAKMPHKRRGGRRKTASTFLDVLKKVNTDLGVDTQAVDGDTESEGEQTES